ncbi:hypothetical protein GCM10028798_20940 [Humibacter antri]
MLPGHESRHVFWQSSASAQRVSRVGLLADAPVAVHMDARGRVRAIARAHPGIHPSCRERGDLRREECRLRSGHVGVELHSDRRPCGVEVATLQGETAQARVLVVCTGITV